MEHNSSLELSKWIYHWNHDQFIIFIIFILYYIIFVCYLETRTIFVKYTQQEHVFFTVS